MNAFTTPAEDFEALAKGAAYCAKHYAVEYRTDILVNGDWVPFGDTWETFEKGYNEYTEARENYPEDELICWEIAADGSATDVTARMIYERESIYEARGLDLDDDAVGDAYDRARDSWREENGG